MDAKQSFYWLLLTADNLKKEDHSTFIAFPLNLQWNFL